VRKQKAKSSNDRAQRAVKSKKKFLHISSKIRISNKFKREENIFHFYNYKEENKNEYI